MTQDNERALNQAAYRRLSDFISKNYPSGRFVAITGGSIAVDAETFDELNSSLERMGCRSSDALIVQAGVDYPDSVTVFRLAT